MPNPLLPRRSPQDREPRTDPRSDPGTEPRFRVLTISSNKGGVGKTTLACNLAVYLRALREDLPVLLLTLDDQPMPDRMFALGDEPPSETIVSGVRRGNLASAIRLGQYGVHYVPASADVGHLKAEISSPTALWQVLEQTDWNGLVIIDTKSDFEILTQNAIAASDLSLVLVTDHASLTEANRVFELLDEWGRPRERARVVLSLVDRRVKYRTNDGRDILTLLISDIRRRGYPMFESFVSRSPAIEGLYTNPDERAYAILHRARKSLIHRQMHHLAQDVLEELGGISIRPIEANLGTLAGAAEPEPKATSRTSAAEWLDRRHQARRSFTSEVAAFREGTPSILSLRALDVSLVGLGIEPDDELASGERVHIALPQPRDEPPLLLWARVARSDGAGARGLAFETPTPFDRIRLEQLAEPTAMAAPGSLEREAPAGSQR